MQQTEEEEDNNKECNKTLEMNLVEILMNLNIELQEQWDDELITIDVLKRLIKDLSKGYC